MHGALPALPAFLALPALSALSALPALPTIHAVPALPYCFNSLSFIDGALQICVALPVSFKIPFVNSCHVQLSLFLLIYQLGADCHRRWIMLQVDGLKFINIFLPDEETFGVTVVSGDLNFFREGGDKRGWIQ